MEAWTLEGQRRGGRRSVQDANGPLPTPEDRVLFVLMSLKNVALLKRSAVQSHEEQKSLSVDFGQQT